MVEVIIEVEKKSYFGLSGLNYCIVRPLPLWTRITLFGGPAPKVEEPDGGGPRDRMTKGLSAVYSRVRLLR